MLQLGTNGKCPSGLACSCCLLIAEHKIFTNVSSIVGKILLKITAVSLVDARSLGKRHFFRLLSEAVVYHEVVGRSVQLHESDAEVKQ